VLIYSGPFGKGKRLEGDPARITPVSAMSTHVVIKDAFPTARLQQITRA
jgi:hypothetical protein